MAQLEPRLVVLSGVAGTGKSTMVEELVKRVPNAFVLEKDVINQTSMYVRPTSQGKLPPFEEYVKGDKVFPNNVREVDTPVGKMLQVDPVNEFYGRHGRDQAYMIMTGIAEGNLQRGKIPVIDCMVIRQIQDGTVGKFMEQKAFSHNPRYLIHVTADEEELYSRLLKRSQVDPVATKRYKKQLTSREAFHTFVTETQPLVPKELSQYRHLLINTSKYTPEECAHQCLEYISH